MEKNLLEQTSFPINLLQCTFYILLLLACFLLFRQSDLTHTYTSSYAYLNGHFGDFYDYNKAFLGGNDYLPLLYVIFATWFIPLKVFHLLPDTITSSWQTSSGLEILWAKLLLALFFGGCLIQIFRLAKILGGSKSEAQKIAILFATSPFVIFAVFIFSQYDIISVYFVLLGLTAYFQRRFKKFVLWFSLAISLKYFALIVFVPLLLLIEKRFQNLFFYLVLAIFPTFLQIALYWHSEIFLGEIFSLAGGKMGDAMGRKIALITGVGYSFLCCLCFFRKIDLAQQRKFWFAAAIFSSLIAYALMFSTVRWHPHWIVIITPFICLSYIFVQHKRLLISIELLAYLGFLVICVNTWENNADINMAYLGIFGDFLPKTHLMGRDILSFRWMPISRVLFYLYLFSPLIILACESGIKSLKSAESFLKFDHINQNYGSNIHLGWYWIRGVIATTVFILLCLVCMYTAVPSP